MNECEESRCSYISPVFVVQGYESGEASGCGAASLHGAGGDVVEHPYVSMAQNL